jgi:hypothetical protein
VALHLGLPQNPGRRFFDVAGEIAIVCGFGIAAAPGHRIGLRIAAADVRGDPRLYIFAAVQDAATEAHEFGAGAGEAVPFEGSWGEPRRFGGFLLRQ